MREQEIAIESMFEMTESRRTCRVAVCIWREELNITNVCDCKRVTIQHEGVFSVYQLVWN